MAEILVVGAGLCAAVIANLIASCLDKKVVVIEKKEHIAGSLFDYQDENGILIQRFGSHIFHTNSEKVWNFVRQFTDFVPYRHKVFAKVEDKEIPLPFNFNGLYKFFPKDRAEFLQKKLLQNFEYNDKISILELLQSKDKDIAFLAQFLYEKIYANYSAKQWGKDRIIPSVIKRVPVRLNFNNNYFEDKYQGIPKEGYTKLIENMLNHKNITLKLKEDYKNIKDDFKTVFYTGSIDEYFNFEYGILPYRSLEFSFEKKDISFYQNAAVINYPSDEPYTRIHEFKHYSFYAQKNKTVIAKEYPLAFEKDKNERYYPILEEKNIALYNKYLEKAKDKEGLFFLGRLGDYKYYDMDCVVLRAIKLFEEIYHPENFNYNRL